MKKRVSRLMIVVFAIIMAAAMLAVSACKKDPYAGDERYQIYLLAKADGYTGTYEEWLTSIKGEQGIQGPAGPQGPKGETGEDGEDGEKGETGETGAKGETGATGAAGKSAFEIWQETNPLGTQEQFLLALKGAKGDDGSDGSDGVDGKSAYEIWESVSANNGKTEAQFLEWLKSLGGVVIFSMEDDYNSATGVHTITITYTNETTKTFTLHDGAIGETGNGIDSITEDTTYDVAGEHKYIITFTDATIPEFSFIVKDGAKGEDGISVVSIEEDPSYTDAANPNKRKFVITYSDQTTDEFFIYNGNDFNGDSRLTALEAAIADLENYDDSELLGKINGINDWIKEVIDDYSDEFAKAHDELVKLQNQINTLNGEIETSNDKFNAELREVARQIALKQDQIAYLNDELVKANDINAAFRDWAYPRLLGLTENANPVAAIHVGYNEYNDSNVNSYFDVLFSGKIKEVRLDYYYTNQNDKLVYIGYEDSSGMEVAAGVDVTWGDAEYAFYNDQKRIVGYGNGFNAAGNYFDRITDGHYTFANYFKVLDNPKNTVVYFTVKTDVMDYVYKITFTDMFTPTNNYVYKAAKPAPAEAIEYADSIGRGLLDAYLKGNEGLTFAQFKDAYGTAQSLKDIATRDLHQSTPKSTSGTPSLVELTNDVWTGLVEDKNATYKHIDYSIGLNAKEIIDGKNHVIYNTTFTVAHNAELTIRNATLVYYVDGILQNGYREGLGQRSCFLVNATGKLTLENVTIIIKSNVVAQGGSPVIYIAKDAGADISINNLTITNEGTTYYTVDTTTYCNYYYRPVYLRNEQSPYPFNTRNIANQTLVSSLAELTAAKTTATNIVLTGNIGAATTAVDIVLNNALTIDLNGYTIYGCIILNNSITIRNGTVAANQNDWYPIMLTKTCNERVIVLENVVCNGYMSGFYTHGQSYGSTLTITNCEFNVTGLADRSDFPGLWGLDRRDTAMYLAGNHDITFTDCTFDGGTGAHIKSGTYVFDNCTFVADAPEHIDPQYWNNGGVPTGSALYIEFAAGYAKPGIVAINDCSFTSAQGYAVESVATTASTVNVLNGSEFINFTGENVYNANKNNFNW